MKMNSYQLLVVLFSGSMSTIRPASMTNDVGINRLQLRILPRVLRNKIGAKLFEPESKMTELYGDIIVPQFGSKLELVLYWVRDYVAIFKKETSLLIYLNQLKVNDISRIDLIVGGDHGQSVFRFLMILLFVVKSEKMLNVQVVLPIFYAKKDNDGILKNIIIYKLQ